MSNVVGIDPSLTGTGIATATYLDTISSLFDGPSLHHRWERLDKLVRRITADLDLDALMVIEAPSLAQRSQAGTLDRNGLWWLLVAWLLDHSVQLVEVPPSTLKKFATGKGNATKPDMRMALYQRAGIDCRDDNQVDACWLRQLGLHLLGDPDRLSLPQTHLAALDKVVRL